MDSAIAEPGDRVIAEPLIARAQDVDQPGVEETGRVAEREQIDGAGTGRAAVAPAAGGRPHDQTPAIERNRAAEEEAAIGIAQVERIILGPEIARTDPTLLDRIGKGAVGKAEQIHRTAAWLQTDRARIANGADRQLQPLQRDRLSEEFKRTAAGIEVVATGVAGPQRGCERRVAIVAQREGEEIDRTGVGDRGQGASVVWRAHRQPQSIQRHRRAEPVAGLKTDDTDPGTRAVGLPERCQQLRCGGKHRVAQIEDMDSARFEIKAAKAGVALRAHRDDIAVERYRAAKKRAGGVDAAARETFEVEQPRQSAAGERCILEGEQIDRAGIALKDRGAIIADRADCKTQAIERDRAAEQVVGFEPPDRDVLAAGIARSDDRLQHRRAELRIAEGEEIDRTGIDPGVARAIIEPRTHRQPAAVERHRGAEIVLLFQPGAEQREAAEIEIACAENSDLTAGVERIVLEGEKICRACIAEIVVASLVPGRTDNEAIAIQRNLAEVVVEAQLGNAEVSATQTAMVPADDGRKAWARKTGIGKGEQIDRAVVEQSGGDPIVKGCAYRKAIAVERDRIAQTVLRKAGDVEILGPQIA